jgi:DNA-binding XRE family transcriptional regulator
MSDDPRTRLKNNVKRLREDRLLTKAELARKAGVSTLTIDRVESGHSCRMDTKRKIILALGMTVAEKDQVFARDDEDANVATGDSTSGVASGGLSSDDSSAKGD